ncbi:MAG: FtsX-like permease family protein [Bacilli bacterium]
MIILKFMSTIIKGMNKIVYLIIGASLLLALVVLYNLVISNVNERTREIATLKVLGFKDREVSSYVYREIIILTIIGIIIGLFLGVILHRYVMVTAETDNIVFLKNIKVWSCLFAFALTLISSIISSINYILAHEKNKHD